MFQALQINREDKDITTRLTDLPVAGLPDGDTLVEVAWSSLNYKDALVLKGLGSLVRNYPHIGGIDLAGRVVTTTNPERRVGELVLSTGWRVGETRFGGYASLARLPGEWLTPVPDGLDLRQVMALGTAGLTAMLCIDALESAGLTPSAGPVIVTGAAGGVGSVAIALLAQLGYEVAVATGRAELAGYLEGLGCARILPRLEPSGKPLDQETWAGAIDTVAGNGLARLLAQMKYGGSVASCGLAGGANANISVVPFLLRGVNILGIDSVMLPQARRIAMWNRLGAIMPAAKLEALTAECALADLPGLAERMLSGQVRGRTVVRIG